jgi:hypothetical protein
VSFSCPFCLRSLVDGSTPTDEWAWIDENQPAHQACYDEQQPPLMIAERGCWDDAEKARRWHDDGRLTTNEYLTGLFFYPDPYLYWRESERIEPQASHEPLLSL